VTNARGAQRDDDRSPLSAVKGNQLVVSDKQKLKALALEEKNSAEPGSEAIEYLLSHMLFNDYDEPLERMKPMKAIDAEDDKSRKTFDNYLTRTNNESKRLSKSSLNTYMFKKYKDYLNRTTTKRLVVELTTSEPGDDQPEKELKMVFKNDNGVFLVVGNDWHRYRYGEFYKYEPIYTRHGVAFKDNQGMYVDEHGQLIKINIETQQRDVIALDHPRDCRLYVIDAEFVAVLDGYAVRIASIVDEQKVWCFQSIIIAEKIQTIKLENSVLQIISQFDGLEQFRLRPDGTVEGIATPDKF